MGNKNNYSLKMPEKQRKVKLLLKDHNLLKDVFVKVIDICWKELWRSTGTVER